MHLKLLSVVLSGALLGLVGGQQAHAAHFSAQPAPASTEQDNILEMQRTPGGYFTLPMYLEGDGPWPFVVDTGASHSAIAEQLAIYYGFDPDQSQRDDVQTLTEEIQADRHIIRDLETGSLQANDLEAVVVATPPNIAFEVFGLLGTDAFGDRRIEINFAQAQIDLDSSEVDHTDGRLHDHARVLIAEGKASRVRQPIRILIDSGAPVSIMNHRFARSQRVQALMLSVDVGSVSRIAPEQSTQRAARIDHLQIGAVCLRSLVALEADLDVFEALGWDQQPAMVLGLDVIQHLKLRIDYENGNVQIDPGRVRERCRTERRIQVTP